MALTKHQKLAREMKYLCDVLDIHCRKTAAILDSLQFHFFESQWIIGRPLVSEGVLQAMMQTHRLGMRWLSPDKELRSAAWHAPFVGCVLTPRFCLQSRVLAMPTDALESEKLVIPWGVKIVLPSACLQKLEEVKLEAFLYCASEEEMSEWIDWFEKEDKALSLTNQLLQIEQNLRENAVFENNMRRIAVPCYMKSVSEYYKLPKGELPSKTLLRAHFAPQRENDLAVAYQLVSNSLAEHKKRHFEDFQRFWRDRLEDLMFEGVPWAADSRHAFLVNYFSPENTVPKTRLSPRWVTGGALDRQTYGAFIRYFVDRFITDPLKHQADGEIALLLWVKIYASRDLKKPTTVKKLLALTTANVSDRYITIGNEKIEVSCGLADLIREYAGEGNLQRQQKLFPNLTIDRLEDHLHRASEALFPPGSVSALPEAFLTFPHSQKHGRINAKLRKKQLENPPKILHDPISWQKLKQQLIEKSKAFLA